MKKRKPNQEDITKIVINHDKETAAAILLQNGYTRSLAEGRGIVDRMNGRES